MDIFLSKCLNKQLRYLLFIFCLLSCRKITSGKETRLQRRFMWKQMHMDNLVNDMATRAHAMKHMFSDLVPTAHSVLPNKILDYLPSETTRVKYIIRNPTTKKPMKIIKIRPNKKIVKILPKPAITLDTKSIISKKKIVPTYLSNDQMDKLEKEQELIAEGRLPHKSEDELLNYISEGEKYTQQSNGEVNNQYNSWLPIFDNDDTDYSLSSSKPSVLSSLHTSIMAEALPKPEKQIAELSIPSTIGQDHQQSHDSQLLQNYYDDTTQANGYEVTEHIAEESISLPITQGSRISVRIGSAPPKYTLSQPTHITNRKKFSSTPPESVSTEEPPNYPPNFLRRFQEQRSNLASVSTSPSTTNSTPALRSNHRKTIAELNADWTPKASNTSNTKETVKFRSRLQGMPTRIQSEKWPKEVSTLSTIMHLSPDDRFSTSENSAEIKSSVFASTTTTTLQAESKQQSAVPLAGRLRKPPLTTSVKIRQSAELPKLRDMRVHNRGTIKFGDKIFAEE
ncbi:uncharacterized protein LOC129246424 isoform X1 [Anastrepha obliqua]|uniref:uncharacterized protein LOC129246424 isoform X1 n=2 Tax=Anastrepha obliqua TaxID=95512 RepID=UPI002409497E|nr:uncharacterized protein LOC129246424 isoform X1 [Anastrepha obliqua]